MTNKKTSKTAVLLIVITAFFLTTVGATLAYLALKTPEINNEFVPAAVTCAVEEQFSNGVKSQVKIRNTGDVSAYIRAAIIANWVKDSDGTIKPSTPIQGQDYTITIEKQGWLKGADGYYYFESPVSANDTTPILISNAQAISQPEGYSLSIKILASAIQSEPAKAVEQSWGKTVEDGKLIVH